MDLQVWFYIIIAIIVVIRSILKKAENEPKDFPETFKPERKTQHNPQPQVNKPKPLTFEELLKEITEAKQPSQPAYEPPRREVVIDYDDDLKEEAEDLEVIEEEYGKRDRVNAVYEEAKRMAFERPSLETTMSLQDTKVEFGKFKPFEKEEKVNLLEEYSLNFQDKEGLKKAVVMSEILNRRFDI